MDTNALLGVLSNTHRRHVLLALHDCPEGEAIELPEAIATRNTPQRELKVKLWHSHLPKLEETGLIHWNQAENVVHRGPAFSEVNPLLDFIVEYKDEIPLDCP